MDFLIFHNTPYICNYLRNTLKKCDKTKLHSENLNKNVVQKNTKTILNCKCAIVRNSNELFFLAIHLIFVIVLRVHLKRDVKSQSTSYIFLLYKTA